MGASYTDIAEVNLFAFVYRLFDEDFHTTGRMEINLYETSVDKCK